MDKCILCNKDFTYAPNWTGFKNKKFCSSYCRQKHWSVNNKELCVISSRKYMDSNRDRFRKLNRDRYHKKRMSQVGLKTTSPYSYPRQKARRLIAREKIEKKCFVCGSTERIQVHHIDENFYNNTLKNLELLCGPCHGKKHRTSYPEQS